MYVCMYICMHVHICEYIFYTFVYLYLYICIFIHFVYLYLLVYNWFKSGHFNIFLIYFELGKHVCIFLHGFILWQIDTYLFTYWLWALSKGTVTFIKGYLVDWVIPEKSPSRDSHWRLDDIFEKTLEFSGLPLYLQKLWIPEKKEFIPGNSAKLHYTLSLAWKSRQGQKPRPMEIPHNFFLISWSPRETLLLF